MGQKISVDFLRSRKRLSNTTNNSAPATELQRSVWFAKGKSYAKLLKQDIAIREFIKKELRAAGLVEIVIRRYFKKLEIVIFVTKPGVVIGKMGATINKLKDDLVKLFGLQRDFKLEISEYKNPLGSSNVIAMEISDALKKGLPYRRIAKGFIEKLKSTGVLGAKICIKGRLNGGDIARKEDFIIGSVPRQTIRAGIDFALVHAQTRTGIIGVKVWLYKGDKFKNY